MTTNKICHKLPNGSANASPAQYTSFHNHDAHLQKHVSLSSNSGISNFGLTLLGCTFYPLNLDTVYKKNILQQSELVHSTEMHTHIPYVREPVQV